MATSSRALEVTIISAEALSIGRSRPVKKNTFVVVRTDSTHFSTTKIDVDGGNYPEWNEKLSVYMPPNVRFLTVEVHCRTLAGERVIGAVSIPVTDFSGGYFPTNYLHFLSYRLRDGRGERNGIINLSVRAVGPESGVKASTCGGASCSRPCMGSPAVDKSCSGIVTGIPVSYRY